MLASAVAVFLISAPAIVEARTKVLQPVFLFDVANTTAQQTEIALRRSLAGRHWNITRDTPNDIEAKLNVRDHSITTRFSWTATQVSIVYVGSENMDYEVDGAKTYIDRYYYRWLKFIKKDVINYSQRANASGALPQNLPADNDDADDDDSPAKAGK
ncbi:hypothetical protein CJD38_07695 [Stenotrophobium rhamnosiphilum]|uniref:Uncharacterized protein n=1 Tax=Stenotrophobium rhamnosiphilum TaxID=2029166 RepID=A0A2T5MF93_9GAMM|nr:hypothetical protein CJD38_07695 [Stenotrophobium rhamnosiphilum]